VNVADVLAQFHWIKDLPYFDQYGYLIGFLIAVLPIPIPNEAWIIPLITISENKFNAFLAGYFISFSGLMIEFTVFFCLVKNHLWKITGKRKQQMSIKHFWHKYGVWSLVILPTIGILPFTSILTFLLLGYLAHNQASYKRIIPFLALGIFIRFLITAIPVYETFVM
jgi:hypothetical protein